MLEGNADMAVCSVYNERLNLYDSPLPIVNMGLLGKFTTNEGWMKGIWSYVFRSDFLRSHNDLKFDTDLFFGEDIFVTIKALYYAKKVVGVPEALYYWRLNLKSVSNSNENEERNKIIREQQVLVGKLLDDFAKEKNIPSKIWETHKIRNYKRQEREWVDNFRSKEDKVENKVKPGFFMKLYMKLCCLFIWNSKKRKQFRTTLLNKGN